MYEALLLVDLAIGRFDAESLIIASLSDTVLTHLINTETEQGRKDLSNSLKKFAILGPFNNIGIASNGPEIPVVFMDCVDSLYNLVHQQEDKKTNLHFFGSNTRTNNGCVSVIKKGLHNNVNVYVSMDRTGNPTQHGNWNLHEIDASEDVINISILYFNTLALAKIPVTFEIVDDTRRNSRHCARQCKK
jgi:hypothetical protein